jgi:dTDP-4-dehydrorhamnose reductase/dTDP-4-dehydrorhamnose 3,5-epimerase
MKLTKTKITDVLIIEPKVFGDHRGWFTESYSKEKYISLGINADFIQDNHSFTAKKGTIRGLHFQIEPKSQSKLIRCIRGKIYDVAVDIRKGSPTYLKWTGNVISEEEKNQIFIPKGFAHGFLSLTDDVEIEYKVDEYYSPDCDRSIRFDDPTFGIEWGISDPVLSEKDMKAPFIKDSDTHFIYKNTTNRLHE